MKNSVAISLALSLTYLSLNTAFAVPVPPDLNPRQLDRLDAQQQQRQSEQLKQQAENARSGADVRMKIEQETVTRLPANESPCYSINHISLIDYANDETVSSAPRRSRFQWALEDAMRALEVKLPYCFGGNGLGVLMKKMQNLIIARGYVTTRVVAQEQDLTHGRLVLTVIPGR
ncbi:POTRA domain-containing protein [Pasteurellaceae bacterium LIM206]|nr:POTRA domain-containing protein [Pasteurellaceae bacterium LIM206]